MILAEAYFMKTIIVFLTSISPAMNTRRAHGGTLDIAYWLFMGATYKMRIHEAHCVCACTNKPSKNQ